MKISSLIPALAAATVLFAALPCHAAVGVVPMQRGSLMVLAADSIAPDKAEAPKAKTPKPTKEEKAQAKFMNKHKADLDRLAELKARVAHLNDNMQTLRNEQSALQAETDRLLPLAAERNRQRALTDSLRAVFHRHLTDRLHEQQARSGYRRWRMPAARSSPPKTPGRRTATRCPSFRRSVRHSRARESNSAGRRCCGRQPASS